MKAILTLALLVSVQVSNETLTSSCTNTDSGCPISTSPSNVGQCLGLDQFTTVSYCGGFALCLGGDVGIRYRCPAGFEPGPRCVPLGSGGSGGGGNGTSGAGSACVPPCDSVVNGCLDPDGAGNGSVGASICPSNLGLFYIDVPEACGKFSMCVMGDVFSLYCPDGYRSDATGTGPKCVPDYTCTDKAAPRLPVCQDYGSGCATNKTIQYQQFCADAGGSPGQFDDPMECGSYYICLRNGDGVKFECPVGYRTDVTQQSICVMDPGCTTPVSPRLPFNPAGCKDLVVGCAVKNITVFSDCQGKPPYRTNINDPTRCGYYEKCTWGTGGYPAIEYICPVGYRADTSQSGQFCQQDVRCKTPESPRLTITIRSARAADIGCSNVAFGCPKTDEPVVQEECRGITGWRRLASLTDCGQYILCLPDDGEGVVIECPRGHRARVSSSPYCVSDPSCNSYD